MATRPTENPLFAESAAPGDVLEPSAVRPGGYAFRAPLPHQEHNWTLRTLGRFARFVQQVFGPSGALTLDTANGELRTDGDTPSEHVFEHRHLGAGVAVMRLEQTDVRLVRLGAPGQQVDITQPSAIAGVQQVTLAPVTGSDAAGLRTEAMLVTREAPPASGNFPILFPADSSLYRDNLVKAVARIRLFDNASVIDWETLHGYNVPGTLVTSGAPLGAWVLELGTIDAITGVVVASVAPTAVGGDTRIFKVSADWDPVEEHIVLRIYHWDSAIPDWVNVNTTLPAGLNIAVNLIVL